MISSLYRPYKIQLGGSALMRQSAPDKIRPRKTPGRKRSESLLQMQQYKEQAERLAQAIIPVMADGSVTPERLAMLADIMIRYCRKAARTGKLQDKIDCAGAIYTLMAAAAKYNNDLTGIIPEGPDTDDAPGEEEPITIDQAMRGEAYPRGTGLATYNVVDDPFNPPRRDPVAHIDDVSEENEGLADVLDAAVGDRRAAAGADDDDDDDLVDEEGIEYQAAKNIRDGISYVGKAVKSAIIDGGR